MACRLPRPFIRLDLCFLQVFVSSVAAWRRSRGLGSWGDCGPRVYQGAERLLSELLPGPSLAHLPVSKLQDKKKAM